MYRCSGCARRLRPGSLLSFCDGPGGCCQLSRQWYSQHVQQINDVRVAILNWIQDHLQNKNQMPVSVELSYKESLSRLGCRASC